jgi:hypothetical protein
MKQISCAKLFEFFTDTFNHFGTFLLNADTEDIEYYMFEEFDCDSITFLHENTLDRLLEGGYISAEVYPLCQLLRKKVRELDGTDLWNVEAVRSAPEWYDLMVLADKIKRKVIL